jgi:hypothetical protein
MTNDAHEGDIGIKFVVTIVDGTTPVNLVGATSMFILFKKPDNTWVQHTAAFVTDGSDGQIYYTTSSSADLNASGVWQIQALVSIGVSTWHSDIAEFTVYENIDEV